MRNNGNEIVYVGLINFANDFCNNRITPKY